jgi:hypothetical protein
MNRRKQREQSQSVFRRPLLPLLPSVPNACSVLSVSSCSSSLCQRLRKAQVIVGAVNTRKIMTQPATPKIVSRDE